MVCLEATNCIVYLVFIILFYILIFVIFIKLNSLSKSLYKYKLLTIFCMSLRRKKNWEFEILIKRNLTYI